MQDKSLIKTTDSPLTRSKEILDFVRCAIIESRLVPNEDACEVITRQTREDDIFVLRLTFPEATQKITFMRKLGELADTHPVNQALKAAGGITVEFASPFRDFKHGAVHPSVLFNLCVKSDGSEIIQTAGQTAGLDQTISDIISIKAETAAIVAETKLKKLENAEKIKTVHEEVLALGVTILTSDFPQFKDAAEKGSFYLKIENDGIKPKYEIYCKTEDLRIWITQAILRHPDYDLIKQNFGVPLPPITKYTPKLNPLTPQAA